jgi:signal transduction histidine kinase
VKRVGFRARLFLILLSFALLPSIALTLGWGLTVRWAIPLVGATGALEGLAASGEQAIAAARSAELTPAEVNAVAAHERALNESLIRARQIGFITERAPMALFIVALMTLGILAVVASRVADHLSRNLERPLRELVSWAELIGRGEPIPAGPARRGAPEFEVLRQEMRVMASELERSRARELEAQRLSAFRETARQVAHELKNPLTPIRFAVDRLRRDAPPELHESVEVLAVESERLERMARNFARFGRLPEGPKSEVDLGELVRYTARATVPDQLELSVDVEPDVPMVRGHYDALAGALSNVLINAVEACGGAGRIEVRVRRAPHARNAVEISVGDSGCGIRPERLATIWEPYVTQKAGGTGLGLAIVRQTVLAHDGTVTAESEPGRGTRIRFTIPADGPEQGDAA